MKRRTYLGVFSTATIGLAGCLSNDVEQVNQLPRPYLGDEDAEVVVDVFEDLMCLGCRNFVVNEFPQIEEQYLEENVIRYNHYDFIVDADPRWSSEVANAARYVQDNVGTDAFFDFKRQFYNRDEEVSVDLLEDIGENVGVEDTAELLESASNSVYQLVLNDDYDEGQQRNVNQTPTIFINGEVSPQPSADIINSMIEQQL